MRNDNGGPAETTDGWRTWRRVASGCLAACGLLCLSICAARADGMCDTTRTAVAERLVCDSPALAWDDRRLNALYALATQLESSGVRELKASGDGMAVRKPGQMRDDGLPGEGLCAAQREAHRRRQWPGRTDAEVSSWDSDPPRCKGCSETFSANFVRQPDGRAIGVWEGTATGTFVTGGLLDGSFDGNILAVRVLGGRGPSWQAGVALLARRGTHLFIGSMYDRSSIGAEQDIEFFDGMTLRKSAESDSLELDYGSPTPGDLASAWANTIDAARKRGRMSVARRPGRLHAPETTLTDCRTNSGNRVEWRARFPAKRKLRVSLASGGGMDSKS